MHSWLRRTFALWSTAALLFVLLMVGATQAAVWGYQSVVAGIP